MGAGFWNTNSRTNEITFKFGTQLKSTSRRFDRFAKCRRSEQINPKRPTFRKLRARAVGAARSSARHAPGRHRLHHGAADGWAEPRRMANRDQLLRRLIKSSNPPPSRGLRR